MMIWSVVSWLMDRVVMVDRLMMDGFMVSCLIVDWICMMHWFMVIWRMMYWLVMNWIRVVNGFMMHWFMMVWGVVGWLMDWVVMMYWNLVMVWSMYSVIVVNEIVDNSPVEFFKFMHSFMMSQCFVVIIVMVECMMLMHLIMVESMVNAWFNRSKEFN